MVPTAINSNNTNNNSRRRPRTMMKPLLLVTSACLLGTAQAFAVVPSAATFRPTTTPQLTSYSPSIQTSSLSFSLTPLEEVMSDSALIQDEVWNGMTHALLDFSSMWGGAATKVRLAAVLGRLFVIGHDVQHEVLPDELAFQLGLLVVACHGLVRTVLPKWKAHFLTPMFMTGQDRKAFRSLFRPAGVSWVHFKELHAESMDWIQVEPGHVLLQEGQDADAVYWLYDGDVQVWSNGAMSHNLSGVQEVAGLGLLGEGRLAKLLDSTKKATTDPNNTKSTKSSALKVVAGESGATLLRMNTTKLAKLLRHDHELTHAVHRLAFMGMQDKLDALLVKDVAP